MKWFDGASRHSVSTVEGLTPKHLFFDLTPNVDFNQRHLDAVILSPKGSRHHMEIDLYSGQRYLKHHFCPADDVWKSYDDSLESVPYHRGFIPRLLDQRAKPQEVIIFGDNKYFQPYQSHGTFSERVRVIGAVVEQYCSAFPCRSTSSWTGRVVLLAVNPLDPDFTKVRGVRSLKDVIDWSEVKAYMENYKGRRKFADDYYASYRLTGEIGADEALRYIFSKGHFFEQEELDRLSKSCRDLYDFTWKYFSRIREIQSKLKIINPKVKKIKEQVKKKKASNNSWSQGTFINLDRIREEEEDLKKKMEVFLKRQKAKANPMKDIRDFFAKYGTRLNTCQKFVRDSDVRVESKRHWFFVYISAYLKLLEKNQVYICKSRSWVNNPALEGGGRVYSQYDELGKCHLSEFERAFDSAVMMLSARYKSSLESYRYLEFDDSFGGSHRKVYSWVYDDGTRLQCLDQRNRLRKNIFPKDISWEPLGTGKKEKVEREFID